MKDKDLGLPGEPGTDRRSDRFGVKCATGHARIDDQVPHAKLMTERKMSTEGID